MPPVFISSNRKIIPKDRLGAHFGFCDCHLLGYDHIDDDDYKKMQKKETAILKKLAE